MLNKKKDTEILRSFASRTVRLYKLSQKLWNKFISFAQLNHAAIDQVYVADFDQPGLIWGAQTGKKSSGVLTTQMIIMVLTFCAV